MSGRPGEDLRWQQSCLAFAGHAKDSPARCTLLERHRWDELA
jgi:hypothetical protein